MPWMIQESQLDPDQRDFINSEPNNTGNVWVQGFAGSGKSILMVYSIKDIKNREPNARIAVVLYTHALIDMFKTGMDEIGVSGVEVMTFYEFTSKHQRYDYIVCDEVQDLPNRVLEAMKSRAKKVYVAGDSNQSIYDVDPKWREPVSDPDDVTKALQARLVKLNYIHRLTRSIISAVQKFLPSMNVWGAKRDTTKLDVQIRLCEANSTEEEVSYIWKEARKYADVGKSTAILIPTHKTIERFLDELLRSHGKEAGNYPKNSWGQPDYRSINRQFKQQGIKLQFIGNGYGSLQAAERNRDVIVMTYHSAKGLDFDNVFLPFLNDNLYISKHNSEAVFMVAMTRSRQNLYITYDGYTHHYVDRFKNVCTQITIGASGPTIEEDDLDF